MITCEPPQVLVAASLYLSVTLPHTSCTTATPVRLVLVSEGHSRTRSGGQVTVGALVLSMGMVIVHVLGQLLLETASCKIKFVPQPGPVTTLTCWALVGPAITPAPVTVQ